ncbi:MAG: hypothetical protein AB1393_13525 [Candidatus Edwardsbacteria bacterium]
MYLISIFKWYNEPPEAEGAVGVTRGIDKPEGPGAWSAVATGKIYNVYSNLYDMDPCYGELDEIALRTAVHELGHQRAGLAHHTGGEYCIMVAAIPISLTLLSWDYCADSSLTPPGKVEIGYDRAYSSFCSACRDSIKKRSW